MQDTLPTVSVITANYNGARFLDACIRTVLDQSLSRLEMIIVDDRSTDESVEVMRAAAARDARIVLVTSDANGGPAAARNRALAMARGQWVAILDSDDLMEPDRLARLVARGDQDGADIVVANLRVFRDGDPSPPKPFLDGAGFSKPRWIELTEYISAACMYSGRPGLGYLKPLIRTQALDGLRYSQDLRIGEDYDLIARLLVRGRKMRLEPAALYHYRQHGSSISTVLRRQDLLQMLAADKALDSAIASLPPSVGRAQAARRRSLVAALAYDSVIAKLKARDLRGALATVATHPQALPLLKMPIAARLRRLGARLGHGKGLRPAGADQSRFRSDGII